MSDYTNTVPELACGVFSHNPFARTTVTEPDPDGSDRGGYYQVTEELTVKGDILVHSLEVDDNYEERIGDGPEPAITDKASALHWLHTTALGLRKAADELDRMAAAVQQTTKFVTDYEPEEDDEEDE